MKLKDLLFKYEAKIFGELDSEVTSVEYDSRRIVPGALFVAIDGFASDGHRFIDSAVEKGAVAILSEREPETDRVPWIQVESVRASMADLSVKLYGLNLSDLKWIGVTGTNGKTTIATIFDQIVSEFYGRDECWQFGTIGNRLGSTLEDAVRTTPEAVDLIRILGTYPTKPSLISMEVSSHALELERVRGINYDVAIFTNLTQDHLDFHESMEGYYLAKKKLFTEHLKNGGVAVINSEDQYGARLISELPSESVISVGKGENAIFRITTSHCSWEKTFLRANYLGRSMKFEAPLVGHFNIMNMALVIASSIALEIPVESIQKTLKKCAPVNGRMDQVTIDSPFSVVVDYAHTPDALKNILFTAGKLTSGRVIAVFGAGGDRDRTKRPVMGKMVALNCDYGVITSDNPRSEKPSGIIADICDGMPTDFPSEVVEDRRSAIRFALEFAREGDSVIIAGKGHETYQITNCETVHFDDREVVIEEWKSIVGERNARS